MENHNLPEIGFYIVLLVSLIASLLNRNLKFSKIMKYSAWWIILALAIILLYSYRFNFLDMKDRVLGELQPTKAIVSENKITINISSDGHFYVDIKINDNSVRFMVDTGASDIVLSLEDARKVGINLVQLEYNRSYQTANGKVSGALVDLPNFVISGIDFGKTNASVNQSDMSVSLLGMSFLRKFKRYEFFEDKLILSVY